MPGRKKVLDEQIADPAIEKPKPPRKRPAKAATSEAAAAPKKRATRKKAAVPVTVAEERPAPPGDSVFLGMQPEVSVIIPAYNEAERIAPVLVAAHAYFLTRSEPFEVLVVDDGSTDRTAEIVERMMRDFPQLRLVRQEPNAGKGSAVARGMQEARGAIRLFADADGATPFEEFGKLAAALQEGADIAFASRALPGSVMRPPQPLPRRLLGRLGNLFIQATNLPGIHDTQCGFKAFTAHAAEAVFPHLRTRRWGFDIEALVLARRLGLKIKEIPVVWHDRPGSTVGARAYLQTLGENLRIRYNSIIGAYPKR